MENRALGLLILLPFLLNFGTLAAEETCSGIVPMRRRPETISISEFGGVGDGRRLNTRAFRNAVYRIQHLRKRGGTMLYVPPGVWLTGNFNLTSHMTLYLARGAVIKATKVVTVTYILIVSTMWANFFMELAGIIRKYGY